MQWLSFGFVRPTRGTALVELALIFTLILMLSIGVYEFGRALQAQVVVVQAAREGARFGMDGLVSDTVIRDTAVAAAVPYVVTATVTHPTATETQVTVTYAFTSNLWFVGNFNIGATMVSRRS
jgi:Flp pilus assembly protein TadG